MPLQRSGLFGPTTPHTQPPLGINTRMVWPRPFSLATTHGISFPVGTEMFHFPTFPPTALYIQATVTGHHPSRVSPFGHPRITVRLPTPRGISQATTSFIGSLCQGIHPVLLRTNKTQKTKMLASTIQFTNNQPRPGGLTTQQCGHEPHLPQWAGVH